MSLEKLFETHEIYMSLNLLLNAKVSFRYVYSDANW